MKKNLIYREILLISSLFFFLSLSLRGEEPFYSSLSFSLDERGTIESRWDCSSVGISTSTFFKKSDKDPIISFSIKHENFKGGKLSFEGLLYEMKTSEITVAKTGLCKAAVGINRNLLSQDYYGMAISAFNDNLGGWILKFDENTELGIWQNIYPCSWLRFSFVQTLNHYNGEIRDDYWYKDPEPFVGGTSAFLGGEATMSFSHFLFKISGAASFNEYLPPGGVCSVLVMGLWPMGRIYTKSQFNSREFVTLKGETREKIFQVRSGMDTRFFDFLLAKVTHTVSVDFFQDVPLENTLYGKLGCFFPYFFLSCYGGSNFEEEVSIDPYLAWETGLTHLRFIFSTRNKVKWAKEGSLDKPFLYNRFRFDYYPTKKTKGGVEVNIDREELWLLRLSFKASLQIDKCTAKGELVLKDLLADSNNFSGDSWADSPVGCSFGIKIRQ